MTEHRYTGVLMIIECANCHMDFGIPPQFEKARRNDHKSFYCPNGHSLSFSGESNEEKLRRERDRLAQRIAERDDEITYQREKRLAAERSASAYKGKATRLKNRAAAGMCPCCNRHFTNLERHISGQHPEFKNEVVA